LIGIKLTSDHNGGSARGYQPGLRVVGRLVAAVTGQRTSDPPTVYLCIDALGANVSVAEEIAYLLEQAGEPYALLDLDYLSWAGTSTGDRAAEFALMLQNLAAVTANYRRAGIRLFVLAYFVRSPGEVRGVREALGLPLRVVHLTVSLPRIERRLASDVTSGRRDDLREAASSIAAAEGAGVEDVVISNDRPIGVVARDVMTFLEWLYITDTIGTSSG
jgi:hypothetical protein